MTPFETFFFLIGVGTVFFIPSMFILHLIFHKKDEPQAPREQLKNLYDVRKN